MHPQGITSARQTRHCCHCGQRLRPWHFRFCSEACYQAAYDAQFVARFWSLVDQTGDCWLWLPAKSAGGYGQIQRHERLQYAHRVAYELTYGPIPDGLLILHTCDVRRCVRPDHLVAGSQLENIHDCMRKGRLRLPTRTRQPTYSERARGERTGTSKLTAEQIAEIRHLYSTGVISQRSLAKRFGIHQATVSHIVLRRSWQHIA